MIKVSKFNGLVFKKEKPLRNSDKLLSSKSKLTPKLQEVLSYDPMDGCNIPGVIKISKMCCILRQIDVDPKSPEDAIFRMESEAKRPKHCCECDKRLREKDWNTLHKIIKKNN